jgi:hypothetical protein
VGNHINITSGEWTIPHSGIGTGVDSYYEYLLKGFLLTGDLEYWNMFQTLDTALTTHNRQGPWYLNVDIHNAAIVHQWHNSLASFYPGLLTLLGEIGMAKESANAQHFIFRRFGAMPEGYNLQGNGPVGGQLGYPLRPEHVESLYQLFRTTGDPSYLFQGIEFLTALKKTRPSLQKIPLKESTREERPNKRLVLPPPCSILAYAPLTRVCSSFSRLVCPASSASL